MRNQIVKTRKWIERVSLIVFAKLVKLLSRFIPYHFGVWAGGILGFCAYYLAWGERKKAISHLSFAFTDKDSAWVRCTARRSFVHLGKAVFEFALITPHRLSQVLALSGEEVVHAALQKGKGAIYVTGHLGNWELMAYAGVARGIPISVIAAPIHPKQVNDLVIELRTTMGVKTIVRGDPGAAKELIRVFKKNRLLAVLIDQDTNVEGAFVDFMGRQAWTPTGAVSMAIKFGAPVLFGNIWRVKGNKHHGTLEAIDLVRTGNDEQDIITNTALLTKKIEACIRNHPEQWVWMHRRWRRQP